MTAEENLSLIKTALDELKVTDVLLLDVRSITSVTDYMLIATGRSTRHVKSSAQKLLETTKHKDLVALSITGLENGEWVLLDYENVIVHIMLGETRTFYDLEHLWNADFSAQQED